MPKHDKITQAERIYMPKKQVVKLRGEAVACAARFLCIAYAAFLGRL